MRLQFLPQLDDLIASLRAEGFEVLAPRPLDGRFVFTPIAQAAELAHALRPVTAPGVHRLKPDDSSTPRRLFEHAYAPAALKPLVFAPHEPRMRAVRDASGRLRFETVQPDLKPTAVLGVRACDLAALALQDAHFLRAGHVDEAYAARRKALFLIAVDCRTPLETCFCAATGDGPAARETFDLAMTELDDGFVVRAGSKRGENLLAGLPTTEAAEEQIDAAHRIVAAATQAQTRTLPTGHLPNRLWAAQDSAHWDAVAERCVACGNCTSVCPTCFCHDVQEQPSLDGRSSETERVWDSCFTANHGHMAGWRVRPDTASRYRQWMTHKFAGWVDQYGRSGCVGCGRCIAWCPAGIDLLEELHRVVDAPPPDREAPRP